MSIFKNNNINNPFGVPNTARPNLGALASKILSDRDAARFKSILGKKDEGNPSISASGLEEAMSDEEIEELKTVEEERRDPLKRIIAWAKKYNLGDEDWVKENFKFNDDGSVICIADLDLDSMTEPDFPESIKSVNGSLSLNGLTSAEGLELPKEIGWSLCLNDLTSAKGLKLPEKIGGYLSLESLISAKGLNLPDTIGESLFLDSLTSAEGLELPKGIGGDLILNSLTSTVGLDLTNIKVWGFIYLEKVPNNEKQDLCEKYPNLRIV